MRVTEWFVRYTSDPQTVEQYSQLTRNCNDRTLLGVLSAALSQLQPPSPQIRIRTESPEDVLRRTDQQAAEVMITGFGDAEFWTAFS